MNNESINKLLDSLEKTKFRGSFNLNKKMIEFCKEKGYRKIESDAKDIIIKHLKDKYPKNDGKQTTMRQTHPVFIAEHATGTCCRGCLERIHKIPKGKELTDTEINYILTIIMTWIIRQVKKTN